MYKNQLQELAQRSCFNLPSYACIREGPDHAPRFKASVNFNGEIFEGPSYCTTLRFAEHSAAEVALNTLSTRGLSRSLTARVLDETGVYKNLLQETAHRAGLNLPVYTTVRSGPGHLPVFTCTVELACMNFTGESAKTKKQAEKNAAMTAWSALKQMPNLGSSCQKNKESESSEEQEPVVVTRDLSNFRSKDENKTTRQREQNQARRSVSSYRDNNSGSSSHCSLQYRQWRSMDLLPDPSSAYPTQRNYFLPKVPPPPQTASKILLPTSSRDHKQSLYSSNSSRSIPVQVKSRLEENQKDEEEWLNGKKPEVTEKSNEKELSSGNTGCVFRSKPTYQRPFSLPNTGKLNTPISDLHRTQQTDIRTRPSRPPTITSAAAAAAMIRTMTQVQAPVPKILNSDGFYAHGIAPAVHIRSVIPVCAAPPMRSPSSSTTPTPQMKEASPSSPHTQKNGSQQPPV